MTDEAIRTMAVRVTPALHAKCTLLAKVEKRSLSDVLVSAIETYVADRWSSEDLKGQLQAALEEIDQRASTERQAIASLLQPTGEQAEKPTARKRGGRR